MKRALREMASQGLVYGFGASLNGLVAFVLIPFFTHELRAAEYGRYALAEMILNLLLVVLALGMNVAILARYPNTPPQDRAGFFDSILTFFLISTPVLGILFLGAFKLVGQALLPALGDRILLFIVVISTLETVWLFFATFYRAEGRAWRYIGASALQVTIGLVSTVCAIRTFGFRDDGILIGRLIGDVAVVIFAMAPRLRGYRPKLNLGHVRALLSVGVPLIPATFSSMWILNSPRVFIESYGTVTDVGVFTMSSKIAGVIQLVFVQPFAMVWMVSIFTIFTREDAARIYARVLTYYVLLGGALALCVGLLAQVVVPLLAREAFPLSSRIVLIMAVASVASGLMYPLNIGPYVLGRTSRVAPVFIVSAVLVTILGIGMVRFWGALGAAVALLVVYLLQALLLARLSQELYPIRFEMLRTAKVLCALAIAFGIVRLLHAARLWTALDWLLVPIFLAAIAAALVVLRFPDEGEIANVRAVLGRIVGGP